jgi:hypothetical protein
VAEDIGHQGNQDKKQAYPKGDAVLKRIRIAEKLTIRPNTIAITIGKLIPSIAVVYTAIIQG